MFPAEIGDLAIAVCTYALFCHHILELSTRAINSEKCIAFLEWIRNLLVT